MSLTVDIKKKIGEFFLDVSFETQGGISGLLGASGSGKSMTLMCIAGIVKPDSGKIILDGNILFDSENHINLTPRERHVGYLFQNYALFPHMTVRRNILCGLHRERSKTKRESRLQEIIELMQLNGLEEKLPSHLSGGQQQRVALARILVGDPGLLVLDEPFSALDSYLREQLQLETKKLLARFEKETLLVTHSRDEAYHLCGKIALIDSGKLIAYKPVKQLFADPGSRHAALITGCKNIVSARKAGDRTVFIPDWNVELTTSDPVRDELCAIGIRAHSFDPNDTRNSHVMTVVESVEGPFEFNMQFRYANQTKESQNVWWLIPKEKRPEQDPASLGLAPADIMLLY